MKRALIAAGLFLLSYVAMNRGLGPHPFLLIVPLAVVVGSVLIASRFTRRRPRTKPQPLDVDILVDAPPVRPQPMPPPSAPARPPGGKARKLF